MDKESVPLEKQLELFEARVNELWEYDEEETKETQNHSLNNQIPKLFQEMDMCIPENPAQKSKLAFLKGKLLNLSEEYDERAEKFLKEALELQPSMVDGWLALGEVQYKNGDFLDSKKSFESAIQHSPQPNKVALRKLSMALWKLGDTDVERTKFAEESLLKANAAVALDVTDGDSWYILGNAHLTHFFLSTEGLYDMKELKMALAAFQQGEKSAYSVDKMDLYFNRAVVYRFLEDYDAAIKGYSMALAMDTKWEAPKTAMEEIIDMIAKIKTCLEKKGGMKAKKRSMIAAGLPLNGRVKDDHSVVDINNIQNGENKGKVLVVKVISNIHNPTGLPVIVIGLDGEENCIPISIYNIDEEALRFEDELIIPNPKVKNIKLEREGQVAIEYKAVSVEIPSVLKINGQPIKLSNLKHSTVTSSQK